jgi:hypothetical protein
MKYSGTLRILLLKAVLVALAASAWAGPGRLSKPLTGSEIERIVAADPGVVLTVCSVSGDIKVTGWDRNQVRARSRDANEIEFKRPVGVADANLAKEITVIIGGEMHARAGSCLLNGNIELDVPRGASVQLRTQNGDISVNDVGTVSARAQSGNVELDGIKQAAEATTIGGRVSLRNSKGSARLHSVGGDVEVRRAGPAKNVDTLEASSVDGDITIEQASYRDLKATTVNGRLSLSGPLTAGGHYLLKTISGSVSLALPADSSFNLDAKLSRGAELVNDFALRLTSEPDRSPPQPPRPPTRRDATGDPETYSMRHVNGVYGSGDASISVSSFMGAIYVRKK